MVSCGSCSQWQHIDCHDLYDQRMGRPRRDWKKQQFYCMRCRERSSSSSSSVYGSQVQGYGMHQQQQYAWSQAARAAPLPKPAAMDPYAHTSDLRYSNRSPPVQNGMGYAQQHFASNSAAAYPPRTTYPSPGMPYGQYPADQRGLSRSMTEGAWGSSNGYAPVQDPLLARTSSGHLPQYSQNGYSSSRLPSAYPVNTGFYHVFVLR